MHKADEDDPVGVYQGGSVMNEKPCGDHIARDVGCKVKECIYHTRSDLCTAQRITVSNEKATRKTETFCATFENRAEF